MILHMSSRGCILGGVSYALIVKGYGRVKLEPSASKYLSFQCMRGANSLRWTGAEAKCTLNQLWYLWHGDIGGPMDVGIILLSSLLGYAE